MGYFYVDESIHERAGFILGAYVFSPHELTPHVFKKLEAVGLRPGVDKYKSSAKMSEDARQWALRNELKELLWNVKLGLVVVPSAERQNLGTEALRGLKKIILANELLEEHHHLYFDKGIVFRSPARVVEELGLNHLCEIHTDQDSRLVGGLQVADLAAHTMSVMLLETLGIVNKTVKAGPSSGYDPELDIELGFELWATLCYHFFTRDNLDPDLDQLEGFTLDTGSYSVHIAEPCTDVLRYAVQKRFGECYMGCVH
jgi:uncharacterized protein DUF3800